VTDSYMQKLDQAAKSKEKEILEIGKCWFDRTFG